MFTLFDTFCLLITQVLSKRPSDNFIPFYFVFDLFFKLHFTSFACLEIDIPLFNHRALLASIIPIYTVRFRFIDILVRTVLLLDRVIILMAQFLWS